MTSSGRRLSAANPTRLRFHLGRAITLISKCGRESVTVLRWLARGSLGPFRLLGQRSWQDVVRFHQQLHQQTELACLFDG